MIPATPRLLILTTIAALSCAQVAAPARGGWWHDGLWGNCTVRTVTAYPVTSCYPAGATCDPGTIAVTQPVVAGHSWQTAYRTRWTQVPITYYRPLTTTNPVTGCTLTCVRPCRTWQWQPRREAYRICRPLHSTIAVNTAPLVTTPVPSGSAVPYYNAAPYYSTPPAAGAPASALPYSGGPADSNASGPMVPADQSPSLPAQPAPGGSVSPYSGPATTFPPSTVPQGAAPPVGVPPGAGSGSGLGAPRSVPVPATRPPQSLVFPGYGANEAPPLETVRDLESGRPSPSELTQDAGPRAGDPRTQHGGSEHGGTESGVRLGPIVPLRPDSTATAEARENADTGRRAAAAQHEASGGERADAGPGRPSGPDQPAETPVLRLDLKPIPDPDAVPRQPEDAERDKVALLTPRPIRPLRFQNLARRSVVSIDWPRPATSPSASPATLTLDDTGWTSMRQAVATRPKP